MIDYNAIFIPVVTAITYSVLLYAKKNINQASPQMFDPVKFAATVLLGLGLGIASVWLNLDISQAGIEAAFLTYGGALVLIESLIKAVYRWYLNPRLPGGITS